MSSLRVRRDDFSTVKTNEVCGSSLASSRTNQTKYGATVRYINVLCITASTTTSVQSSFILQDADFCKTFSSLQVVVLSREVICEESAIRKKDAFEMFLIASTTTEETLTAPAVW